MTGAASIFRRTPAAPLQHWSLAAALFVALLSATAQQTGAETLNGTNGNDLLAGKPGRSIVRGRSGNDIIFGDPAAGAGRILAVDRVSTLKSGEQTKWRRYLYGSGLPVFSPDGTKVAFVSDATNLVPGDKNGLYDVFVKSIARGTVFRASTSSRGVGANGKCSWPAFSPDGLHVAFVTDSTNLVPGDTNEMKDVFLKNLRNGIITRISTTKSGGQALGGDWGASGVDFSPDGTKITFSSDATNLVPDDTNGKFDVFVKNLVTGAVTRVSTAKDGSQAGGDALVYGSWDEHFSPDGRKLAFTSDSPDLVPRDTNEQSDVFVKDLFTGAIIRASTSEAGNQGNSESHSAVFSPDGSKVAFVSYATNLVRGDTTVIGGQVFIKDLVDGSIAVVSANAAGEPGDAQSLYPSFSPDGSGVAFWSNATNLVTSDTNGAGDIFLKKLASGVVARVSTDGDGGQVSGTSRLGISPVSFSPDGTRVAYSSDAEDLIPDDTNALVDVFVATLATGPAGNDLISGGAGRDRLLGAAGMDRIAGGTGPDIFVYSRASDSTESEPDTITDFRHADHDVIDVTAFGLLAYVGKRPFSRPGQMRFARTGTSGALEINTTGDTGAEFRMLLENVGTLTTNEDLKYLPAP